jgi:oxygen-independent coproporphyrinogen-3 oxidase
MSTSKFHPSNHLVEKYECSGPRYTSYPTAPVWSESFSDQQWNEALAEADTRDSEPIALYVHLPFCQKRCLFCACNVVITTREDVVEEYLTDLALEIDAVAAAMPKRRKVSALHWGGGTPTHLNCEQLTSLYRKIEEHWHILDDAEISIEVHPPVTSRQQLETLAGLGFNRISFGVQDLDGDVQQLIGRDQSVQQTEDTLTACRELGIRSVNFDLIYGLPGQTESTWQYTLDEVVRMRPERLAIYSYAHVPWLHPHQKRMETAQMPGPNAKLQLLKTAASRLSAEAGYVEIGFDHFAVPSDDLAKAADHKKLYRNFMGYTVKPASDYIGFGMSAISEVGHCFAQKHSKLNRWREAVQAATSGVAKGHQLSTNDRCRKLIIERLSCNLHIEFSELIPFGVTDFPAQFAAPWTALAEMEADGLVLRTDTALSVTELGRHFIRNVCMLFDEYLEEQLREGKFSRTV